MTQDERLAIIVDEVNHRGTISVNELIGLLNVSGATIRSDIRELDDRGQLKKIYGGAKRLEIAQDLIVHFNPGKFFINAAQKKAICERAFSYIDPEDSIILDDSTTCCYLANIIKQTTDKKLTVITNSLYVASLLSNAAHVNLYIGGGQVTYSPPSVMDAVTAESFGNYHVKKFFTGIYGIDLNTGLNSQDMTHMIVKKQMIKSSEQIYCLADSSKFGRSGLFTVSPLTEVHQFITDNQVPQDVKNIISSRHLNIEYVTY